jgi:cytochrome c peroxidase
VAFQQLGFGKNGFGVDYGRYNSTFNPEHLYQFRTPSLYNVTKTAPYGHSGSVATLEEAIIAHFDPIALVNFNNFDHLERHQFAKVLAKSDSIWMVNYLTRDEVITLVDFLEALSF